MAVNFAEFDLTEGNEAKEQGERRLFVRERSLRFGTATDLWIQILDRIGRTNASPYRFGKA